MASENEITREEFYRELRDVENRAREYTDTILEKLSNYIEKSHISVSATVSNNLGELKKEIAKIRTDVQLHIEYEKEYQKKMEAMIQGINVEDLRGVVTKYRDALGVQHMAAGIAAVCIFFGIVGGAVIWLARHIHLHL